MAEWVVTEQTAVEADTEEEAIERVVNLAGDEVIDQSAMLYEDYAAERAYDPTLILALEPHDIRSLFDGDDHDPVAHLNDEELRTLALDVLSRDSFWRTVHELVVVCIPREDGAELVCGYCRTRPSVDEGPCEECFTEREPLWRAYHYEGGPVPPIVQPIRREVTHGQDR